MLNWRRTILFGVKKFHNFLFGDKFTIYSDHRPLHHIFSEHKTVPAMASARIQRWALTGAYSYLIVYKPGKDHAKADGLCRLPLPEFLSSVPQPGETVLLLNKLQYVPVTAAQIKCWTDQDPFLSRVRNMVLHGWKEEAEEELQPFNQCSGELSVMDGCILWGGQVVVPKPGQN